MYFSSTLFENYELAVLLKIVLAVVAGAIIGMEREMHGRPAGLRTHLLVSAGSCLVMLISEAVYQKYGALPGSGVVRIDPGRIAAQVVTGIGFLGAGVIIKEGFSVRGLTTAASLWVVSAIGMAFGLGMISAGFIATAVTLMSLLWLKKLEPRIRKDRYLHLTVTANDEPDVYPALEALFTSNGLRISDIQADHDLENRQVCYRFVLTQHKVRIGRDLSAQVAEISGIKKISYK